MGRSIDDGRTHHCCRQPRVALECPPRSRTPWAAFDVQGLAPIGYAVFALSLGTLAGLVFRRTIPAMALTLFVFVGVRILIAQVRPHFMTAVTGSALDVKQGSWLVSANYYTDAQGHHVPF